MTSEPTAGEQPSGGGEGETRADRKERTRRAILDAAISLRQVARQVGVVPTAFYRHFDSLDLLGLALVTMAERLVDDPDSEERTLARAGTQLRMLLVGAVNLRSREGT